MKILVLGAYMRGNRVFVCRQTNLCWYLNNNGIEQRKEAINELGGNPIYQKKLCCYCKLFQALQGNHLFIIYLIIHYLITSLQLKIGKTWRIWDCIHSSLWKKIKEFFLSFQNQLNFWRLYVWQHICHLWTHFYLYLTTKSYKMIHSFPL